MKPDIEGIKLRVGEFTTGRNRAIILQEPTLQTYNKAHDKHDFDAPVVPPQATIQSCWIIGPFGSSPARRSPKSHLGALLARGLGILDAVRAKVAPDPA